MVCYVCVYKYWMTNHKYMSNKQIAVDNEGKKSKTKIVTISHPRELSQNYLKWKFTVGENRILVNMIESIKANQRQDEHPQIDISENVTLSYHYRDLLPAGHNNSERIVEDLVKLREKTISFPSRMIVDGKEMPAIKVTGLITEFKYSRDNEYVELKLNQEWYGFLIDLDHGYTKYNKNIAFNLSSSYSIKMYYFCAQWINNKVKKTSLQAFRDEFNIDESLYQKRTASHFQERILKPCKKILDRDADISFSYTPYKNGKRIAGFTFHFYYTKNLQSLPNNIDQDKINEFYKLLENYTKLTNHDKARVYGLCRTYGLGVVKENFMKNINMINDILKQPDKTITDALAIVLSILNTPKLVDLDD